MSAALVDLEMGMAFSCSLARSFGRRFPADASDLHSAAREGLAAAARTYDPARGTTWRTWAGRNIRWMIWNHIRSAARHPRAVPLDIPSVEQENGDRLRLSEVLADPQASALDRLEVVERDARVRTALSTLREADRALLEALYTHDRQQRELAREMGLTEGGLTRRRDRALARLRDALAGMGVTCSP